MAKIKVHEIAKELGKQSKEIISFLQDKGIEAKAAQSSLEEEASDNTKKKFTNMCKFYKVPIYFYASKENLGRAIGREMRSSVAVTNGKMAENIWKHLEES